MNVPRADVALSIYELLFGRVVLRAVTLDSPQLTLVRAADGTLSLDLGSLTEATEGGDPAPTEQATPIADLLAELARPAGSDKARSSNALFGQLRRVRIHDARVAVVDRPSASPGGRRTRRSTSPDAGKAGWTGLPSWVWQSVSSRRD